MGAIWRKSGTVEWHQGGAAAGALAYFYQGNTTTPITVYEDPGETTPHEHPVEADANGRWPEVYIPFIASFDEKVVAFGGTQLTYFRGIPNPNPVEEAADEVDATQIYQTGDWKFTTKGGTLDGFVRANGRTIGTAASGATERANDDTEPLYAFLWNNHADGICPVIGGRGASAAADFAVNKPITLFDCRGGHPLGVDDMGNLAADAFANVPFETGDATTGGSVAGANDHELTDAELAEHDHPFSTTTGSSGAHTHTGTTDSPSISHFHTLVAPTGRNGTAAAGSDVNEIWRGTTTGSTDSENPSHSHNLIVASGGSHDHTVEGTTAATGDGDAHNNVSRSVLGTWFIKL